MFCGNLKQTNTNVDVKVTVTVAFVFPAILHGVAHELSSPSSYLVHSEREWEAHYKWPLWGFQNWAEIAEISVPPTPLPAGVQREPVDKVDRQEVKLLYMSRQASPTLPSKPRSHVRV